MSDIELCGEELVHYPDVYRCEHAKGHGILRNEQDREFLHASITGRVWWGEKPADPREEYEKWLRRAETLTQQLRETKDRLVALAEEVKEFDRKELLTRIQNAYAVPYTGPTEKFYVVFAASDSPYGTLSQKHSVYPKHISGAGHILVEASSFRWAEALVWVHVGDEYAGLRTSRPDDEAPIELGRMDASGNLQWHELGLVDQARL